MCVWAIIPVKPLNRAKSRLADVLSQDQRTQFAEAMLRQVLAVTTSVPQVVGTLVVSRDTKVLAIARDYGAKTVQESGSPKLNEALMRATQVVRSWGCTTVLILPADLPFISHEDIENIIELCTHAPSIVIATDRDGDGTNALLVRPPGLIEYEYGEGSYARHVAQARAAGATVKEYSSERLMLDIDLPENLDEYNQLVQAGNYDYLPLLTVHSNLIGE